MWSRSGEARRAPMDGQKIAGASRRAAHARVAAPFVLLTRRRDFEIEDVLYRYGFALVHHRRVFTRREDVERRLVEKGETFDDATIAKRAFARDRAFRDDGAAHAGHDGFAWVGELAAGDERGAGHLGTKRKNGRKGRGRRRRRGWSCRNRGIVGARE